MRIITSIFALCMFAFSLVGQTTYNGISVIKASNKKSSYRIGSDYIKEAWNISPQIKADSLLVVCSDGGEDFAFITDSDSISFKLFPEQSHGFYVLLKKDYAFTVVTGVKPDYSVVKFDEASRSADFNFVYDKTSDTEYLNLLRSKYPIENLISDKQSDTEKVLSVMNWVHNQWKHDGNNTPKSNDAISILDEAKGGKNFRCVEYGIVTSACLNAVGFKARTLALKTKDVETRKYGAGHVLLEVFITDLQKWVLLDGQWDAMPMLNGVPLNAVEFQKAIAENYSDLEIKSTAGISKRKYVNWINPYLYYLSVSFDNRVGVITDRKMVDGKSSLMLVPVGAKNPTVFQIDYKIDNCIYTNSYNQFYAAPLSQK